MALGSPRLVKPHYPGFFSSINPRGLNKLDKLFISRNYLYQEFENTLITVYLNLLCFNFLLNQRNTSGPPHIFIECCLSTPHHLPRSNCYQHRQAYRFPNFHKLETQFAEFSKCCNCMFKFQYLKDHFKPNSLVFAVKDKIGSKRRLF